jgi:hypothetical protein
MGVVFPRFGLMVSPLLNSILLCRCIQTDGAVLRRVGLLFILLQFLETRDKKLMEILTLEHE